MLRTAVAVLIACALGPATAAAAAPMFVNCGFETGDFTGWTVGGNAVSGVAPEGTPITGTLIPDNFVDARSGSFAAFAKLQSNDPATTLTLEQTVDVDPGVPYSVTVRRGVFGSGINGYTMSLNLFVDGELESGSTLSQTSGPAWTFDTMGNYVFPAGQTSATFRFEIGGAERFSGGLAGFSIDDVTIQEVPEPTGLAVVCLTAAAALRRRRRRLS